MVKRKTGDREVLFDSGLMQFFCVFVFLFFLFFCSFFFFFFSIKGIHMLLDNMSSLKNAGFVTLTIVVNDS